MSFTPHEGPKCRGRPAATPGSGRVKNARGGVAGRPVRVAEPAPGPVLAPLPGTPALFLGNGLRGALFLLEAALTVHSPQAHRLPYTTTCKVWDRPRPKGTSDEAQAGLRPEPLPFCHWGAGLCLRRVSTSLCCPPSVTFFLWQAQGAEGPQACSGRGGGQAQACVGNRSS